MNILARIKSFLCSTPKEYDDATEYDDETEHNDGESIPNNAAGDRAAERDPIVSSHRDCERARIAAIVRSPEAQCNRRAAYAFALDSAMPRDQAIAMLKAIGPETLTLAERMANVPRIRPGRERTADDRKATALAILNAGRKFRGEPLLDQLPS